MKNKYFYILTPIILIMATVFKLSATANVYLEEQQRGCCSWHGGVCGCDRATGRIKCCDGQLSPSCLCGQ